MKYSSRGSASRTPAQDPIPSARTASLGLQLIPEAGAAPYTAQTESRPHWPRHLFLKVQRSGNILPPQPFEVLPERTLESCSWSPAAGDLRRTTQRSAPRTASHSPGRNRLGPVRRAEICKHFPVHKCGPCPTRQCLFQTPRERSAHRRRFG